MELSEYQKEIIKYFKENPTKNMKVNALAGTGKSFILEKLTENSTSYDVYIAFNNSIAEEFKDRIKNPKTKVTTIHSLAYSIMNYNLSKIKEETEKELGKKTGIGNSRSNNITANLDNLKIYKIVDTLIYNTGAQRVSFGEAMFYKENFVTLYNVARLTNIKLNNSEAIEYLISEHNLFHDYNGEGYERFPPEKTQRWLEDIDQMSIGQFERYGTIDFTDMLYLTCKYLKSREWEVPYWAMFVNVLADEVQDFSNLQLSFLRYIKRKNGRYVMVGDFFQSCYQFCGANANSFKLISKAFAPIKEFDLPINYRCPTSHLSMVNNTFDIPIKPRPNAPTGDIVKITKDEICKYVKPGDMVISRKNKWLPDVLLDLATHGIPLYMQDKEAVASIKKVANNTKAKNLQDLIDKLNGNINKYAESLLETASDDTKTDTDKMIAMSATNNKIDNMQFVVKILNNYIETCKKNGETRGIEDFNIYLDNLLNTTSTKDAVRLCSVHKAKGLEAENVFVLNEAKSCKNARMTKEQNQQEDNLSYISMTRSKNKLYLVKEEE